MKIAIYDTKTGYILRAITVPQNTWRVHQDVDDGEDFFVPPPGADLHGKLYVEGEIVDAHPSPAEMAAQIAQAVHTINRLAARDRGASEAKDTLHAAKVEEAQRWVVAGSPPVSDDYPLLAGGAEGAGRTLLVEAQLVLDHASVAGATARAIERRRTLAKTAARAAITSADIKAAIRLYEGKTP